MTNYIIATLLLDNLSSQFLCTLLMSDLLKRLDKDSNLNHPFAVGQLLPVKLSNREIDEEWKTRCGKPLVFKDKLKDNVLPSVY